MEDRADSTSSEPSESCPSKPQVPPTLEDKKVEEGEEGRASEEAGKGAPKSKVEKAADSLKALVSVLTSVTILSVIPFIGIVALLQTRDSVVLIDPIEISKELKERGFTPNSVAQRLSSELSVLQRRSQQPLNRKILEPTWIKNDIQVPVSGLSLANVIRFFSQPFGYEERHVTGELLYPQVHTVGESSALPLPSERVRLILRLTGGEERQAKIVEADVADLDKVFSDGAIQLAKLVNPYMLAAYYFQLEFKDRVFTKTEELIKICIANGSRRDQARALALWGTLLLEQGKAPEAIEKFEIGQRYANLAEIHISWGNALSELGDYRSALQHYQAAAETDKASPQLHNAWGNLLNMIGRPTGAREHYRQTTKLEPSFIWGHVNLGYSLADMGMQKESAASFEEAARLALIQSFSLEPGISGHEVDASTELYEAWGNALTGLGNWKEAIQKYEQALLIDPNDYYAVLSIGDALQVQGDYPAATARYQRAIAMRPALANGHNGLGDSLSAQGLFSLASKEYEAALARSPSYVAALQGLAKSRRMVGDYSGALQALSRAEAVGTDPPYLHFDLAGIATDQGRYAEAEDQLRREIKFFPRTALTYRVLGDLLVRKGRYQEAETTYSEGLRLASDITLGARQPSDLKLISDLPANYVSWATSLTSLGRFAEALVPLEAASALGKRDWALEAAWGDMLAGTGSFDAARARYENAARIAPANPDALLPVAEFFALRSLHNDALPLFRKALGINPNNARAHNGIGRSLLATGSYRQAVDELNRASAVAYGDSWTHSVLGSAYERIDEPGKALAEYESIVRMGSENPRVHSDVAWRLKGLGCNDNARLEFLVAVSMAERALGSKGSTSPSPLMYDVLMAAGDAHFGLGGLENLKSALAYYRRAAVVSPLLSDAYNGMADVLAEHLKLEGRSTSEFNALESSLAQAKRLNPDSPDTDLQWANLLKKLKGSSMPEIKLSSILEHYGDAISKASGSAEAYFQRADLLAREGTAKELLLARQDYDKVIEIRPSWKEPYVRMANLLADDHPDKAAYVRSADERRDESVCLR